SSRKTTEAKVRHINKSFLDLHLVTDSPYRFNVFWSRGIVFNLSSEPTDMDIYHIIISKIGFFPDIFEKLSFCEYTVRICSQQAEDLKFFSREVKVLPVLHDCEIRQIDLKSVHCYKLFWNISSL